MLNKTFSVALCAAALSVCATVQAQWPIRYNNSSFNGDDEAFAVAVDRRGNVYTAGKSWNGSAFRFDFLVDSYDAAGFRRPGWPVGYDGPGDGDDIATSIHVDPASGNVYVGGTSYGGATSGFDFCVIAYTSAGDRIWPASGNAGTGYIYHNGAIRSTSSEDEGAERLDAQNPGTANVVQTAMAVREEYSPENRVIAVTGIVGNSSPTIGQHWRTVVLQPSSSPPHYPERMDGWPVDLNNTGNSHDEQPRAVAIYSDNSVYVTGFTSLDGENDWFTTVRYKPTGNPNAEFWRYDWAPTESKPTGGYDIALDKDGDAYATGVVVVGTEAANYGTIAFEKDPDEGGNAVVKWAKDYNYQGGSDIASSISLSFEVESGALVPYVYVTGQVQEELSATNVATVRYRGSDGNEEWVQIYGSGQVNEMGLDVIGAGYGNAYVVGRSAEDLFVIGYMRDGSVRLAPLTYHFVDFDEGRMGAMVGAGALVATGASDGSGTSKDFVSQRFFQTTGASYPSSFLVQMGVHFGGGLSDLQASDDSYLVVREDLAAETDPSMRVQFTGSVAANNPTEIRVNFEGRSDATSTQEIELYDYLTTQWVLIDKRPSTFADSRLYLVIKDDPGRFLNAGEYKLRVSYRNPAAELQTWKVYFDLVSLDVLDG